jgi:UDP-N-acetylglucosamine 4,6-dehydratase
MKSILVTGGTGSFGQHFVKSILACRPDIERIVVFSRDELKQFEMAERFPSSRYPQLRFFIGDVRDKERLQRAIEGVDTVIHAAALKQVPAAEYNPSECIKTNILGAQNIVDAVLNSSVKRVVALSTDKAAAPINLYGATKLCSDKLFVAANNVKGSRDLRISVVRYGNVVGSRGSVIPYFLHKRTSGMLPITDPRMTRFSISLNDGVKLVLHALQHSLGGEIFIPKIPSYRILDVAEAIAPGCKKEIVGLRPGEKLHEEMVTESDSFTTIEGKTNYIITPMLSDMSRDSSLNLYSHHHNATPVPVDFKYSSGQNSQWLTVEDIRQIIKEHLDPNFEPLN